MYERIPLNEMDPSIPNFKFTEKEREEMRKRMSEDEIDQKEAEVRNRIAQKHAA